MDVVILKEKFNINNLLKDIKIAEKHNEYTQRKYVKGASVSLYRDTYGWRSIPLHSINGVGGNEGNILRPIDNYTFKPTETLYKCPYFKKILDDLKTNIYLVRLMKLDAGGYIAPHADTPHFKYRRKMIRTHLPIITNNKIDFYIDNNKYYLESCKWYYTRLEKVHKVKNNSDKDRIHLVVDIKPTMNIMKKLGLNKIENYKKFYSKNAEFDKDITFKRINKKLHPITTNVLIMCVWKRYMTLEQTLKDIESQNEKIDIYLWNNNYDNKTEFEEIVNKFKESHLNIYIHNSKDNIKAIARMIVASIIEYLYDNIIFLDDDMKIHDNALDVLIEEKKNFKNTALSIWSLDFNDPQHYWDRTRKKNHETCHYAGTPCCIYPTNINFEEFLNWIPILFKKENELPDLIEDLMLNVYFKVFKKGILRASKANVTFINGIWNGKDALSVQGNIRDKKNKYLHFLIEKFNYPFSKNYEKHPQKQICNNNNNKFVFNHNLYIYKDYDKPSNKLVIFFSNIGEWSTISDISNIYSNNNCNKLFVNDKHLWYLKGFPQCSNNIQNTLEYLKTKINESKCNEIIMVGYGSGGFGAILYGSLLNIQNIVVYNPYTYLDDKTRQKYNDNRWDDYGGLKYLQENIDNKYMNLKYIPKSNSKIIVLYSRNNIIDVSHYYNLKCNENLNVYGYGLNQNNFTFDSDLQNYIMNYIKHLLF